MKISRFRTASLLLASFLASSLPVPGVTARAAETDWAESEGGRMRIVSLAPDSQGVMQAALQIDLQPGWITYWREPGGSGVPPQITPSDDGQAEIVSIDYPVPKHIKLGEIDDIAYDRPVTLPFKVALKGKDGTFGLTAFIGVCREICIPFQANFTLPIANAGDDTSDEEAIIGAAMSALPQAPSADFNVEGYTLSDDHKFLHLNLTLPEAQSDDPEIIATGPVGYVFTSVKNRHRQGKSYSADLAVDYLPDGYVFAGSGWKVLVKSGDRAIETTLAFQ